MEAAELTELLTRLRNSGRASAYDAIASFAKALRELPPDFAEQLQREADARIASGGALGALPKRDLRGAKRKDEIRKLLDVDKLPLKVQIFECMGE